MPILVSTNSDIRDVSLEAALADSYTLLRRAASCALYLRTLPYCHRSPGRTFALNIWMCTRLRTFLTASARVLAPVSRAGGPNIAEGQLNTTFSIFSNILQHASRLLVHYLCKEAIPACGSYVIGKMRNSSTQQFLFSRWEHATSWAFRCRNLGQEKSCSNSGRVGQIR
jgi:hypothetical protein